MITEQEFDQMMQDRARAVEGGQAIQSHGQAICLFCGGAMTEPPNLPARLALGICSACRDGADPAVLEWMQPAFARLGTYICRHYHALFHQIIESHRATLEEVCRLRDAAIAELQSDKRQCDREIADLQAVILREQFQAGQIAQRLKRARSWAIGLVCCCGMLLAGLIGAALWIV